MLRATYKSVALQTAAAVHELWWEIKTLAFGKRKKARIRKNLVRKCQKKFRTFLCLEGTLVVIVTEAKTSNFFNPAAECD